MYVQLLRKIAAAKVGSEPAEVALRENLIISGESEQVSNVVETCLPALMQKHHVPGISIAVVNGGKIAWHKAFGVLSAGKPEKVDEDSVFEACSMTKPLVTYAALQLVQRGILDLDKPLVNYLEKPYLENEPLHEQITVRMVMSHTSGFPNWRQGGSFFDSRLQMLFEPGTKFGYSGEGYMYLQHVLEHLLKKPLDVFVKESLLDPIGMTGSSLKWQQRYEHLAADGHNEQGVMQFDQPRYFRAGAAYSLFCTPTDYARFLVEMMRDDRSAPHSLSKERVQEMLSPQTKVPDHTVYIGLGWLGQPTMTGVHRFFHDGGNHTGHQCLCEFYPQNGAGIVIMTNGAGGGRCIAELMEKLRGEVKL